MIGSRLVEFLLKAGADVWVLDDFSRGSTKISGARYIRGDATNLNTCLYAFRGASSSPTATPADVVFNLAAKVAGVMYNMNHHLDMFYNNVNVLAVPMMVAGRAGVKHFAQVSSACVYNNDHNHPCIEKNGLVGEPDQSNLGYGLAKRMGEYVAMMSDIEHVVVIRPSNVYGPRDYFDDRAHVIPSLIVQYHSGNIRPAISGGAVREFLYVDDAARAMMYCMALGDHKTPYNIGTGGATNTSIADLHRKIAAVFGRNVAGRASSTVSDNIRWSICKRLESLGFKWAVDIDDGLARTTEWYLGQ